MRTTSEDASVRLYRVGEDGAIETLFYGPLRDALVFAGTLPDEGDGELYLQTDNDVIALGDLLAGR